MGGGKGGMMGFQREVFGRLYSRAKEPRKFIQVMVGPRQVGKTTLALALKGRLGAVAAYHSADDAPAQGAAWIDQIWDAARIGLRLGKAKETVLIFDEIQKIPDWSAAVKKHWDRDSREGANIKAVLLGSSRLLLMDGLSESLLGRFELNYVGHWSFAEMKKAFGFSAEQYQWFGGYPGAAAFVSDEPRFKEYIRGSVVEPTMVRDILLTSKIDKPALLRQMFDVGAAYSSQIVSFNKVLGQLQDAGNTTTLARYLRLLDEAGLLCGLNKYSARAIETKGTIPKFQVHNTALLSALSPAHFEDALKDRAAWGGVFESSVGAHLIGQAKKHPNVSLYYWRENDSEIDYVAVYGKEILGIEVKSGDEGISEKASAKFKARFPNAKLLLVGKHGIPYEAFMSAELPEIFAGL